MASRTSSKRLGRPPKAFCTWLDHSDRAQHRKGYVHVSVRDLRRVCLGKYDSIALNLPLPKMRTITTFGMRRRHRLPNETRPHDDDDVVDFVDRRRA